MSQRTPWGSGCAAAVAGGGGGGSATSVTSVNRVAGTDAGGTSVVVTGVGFSGLVAGDVLFGTNAATITGQTGTTCTCTVPAASSAAAVLGTSVNITVAGKALNDGFTYLPAKTTDLIALADFEDGTVGTWSSGTQSGGGSYSVSTDQAQSGSKSLKCVWTALGSTGLEKHLDGTDLPATGNGHWTHFYVYVPSATASNVGTGQIKLTLNRNAAGSTPNSPDGGYGELSLGTEAKANANEISMIGDTSSEEKVGTNFTFTPASWVEILIHLSKTGGSGTIQWWAGQSGALSYRGSNTSTHYGTNWGGASPRFYHQIALYSQDSTYPMTVYVDNIIVQDGCGV